MAIQAAGEQPARQRGLLVIYGALRLGMLLAAPDQAIAAAARPGGASGTCGRDVDLTRQR